MEGRDGIHIRYCISLNTNVMCVAGNICSRFNFHS